MNKNKEYTSSRFVKVGRRMVKSSVDFDAALGAALIYGSYRDRRKILSQWELLLKKYDELV